MKKIFPFSSELKLLHTFIKVAFIVTLTCLSVFSFLPYTHASQCGREGSGKIVAQASVPARYWVGGTGNWSDTSHWSTSSGGSGGASVPTSSDAVFFDANSFSAAGQTVTVDTDAFCLSINFRKWGTSNIQGVNGISAVSPTEVWIVGSNGNVWEYDGSNWTQHVGTGLWGANTINGVSAYSSTEVWIVGNSGHVWEYDGTDWTQHSGTGRWEDANLGEVFAYSPTEVWIVGANGNVWEYDGSSWSQHSGTGRWDTQQINGVSVYSSTEVWIVGNSGHVWEHDGSSWTQHSGSGTWGTRNINGVSAYSPTEVWIVGRNGSVWEHDGSSWTQHSGSGTWGTTNADTINGVSVHSPTEVWIVGSGGDVWEHDGSSWSQHSGTGRWGTQSINGVAAFSSTEVWVVGNSGNVWEHDGSSWSQHSGMTGATNSPTLELQANLTVATDMTLISGMTLAPNNYTVIFTGDGTLITGGQSFYHVQKSTAGTTLYLADGDTLNSTILTIDADTTFDMTKANLSLVTLNNDGTLTLEGDPALESITITNGMDVDSGLVKYYG